MGLTNYILGYDAESIFSGYKHFERFKKAGAVFLGSAAVAGAGLVLSAAGVPFSHEIARVGEFATLVSGIGTVIEARLSWGPGDSELPDPSSSERLS